MVHLPSPELLKRKILIKNKKKRSLHSCKYIQICGLVVLVLVRLVLVLLVLLLLLI